MYFVAALKISSSDLNNTFGSRPPWIITFFKLFLAHIGSTSESKLMQSGFTISLKSLYLSPIPLGKQILGIPKFLQNFTISKFGKKQ